ncbi:unnamed protein product [Prorocentrum cordatum]|uniref:Uncharacterized protein n=1 Tax=Prorocentrum cordatum TaxID=2364126 RepID=A0ABN9UJ84_9DINO|nr:unnamed protein product [Polarella glacialis]
MREYFLHMYQLGYGPSVGRSVFFFGHLLLRSDSCELEGSQLRDVECSLAGWANKSKEVVKGPAPQEVLLDMGLWMTQNGLGESAACLALHLDDYGRPSESIELAVGSLLPPVHGVRGSPSREWGVIFAPAELGFVTKTGRVDNSAVLGSPSRQLAPTVATALLARASRRAFETGARAPRAATDPATPLFPGLTLAQCERDLRDAAKELGCAELGITPQTTRHAGPPRDIYHKHRNLEQVRRRGRRAAKKSVTRHERHAKLLKQCAKLDSRQIARMNRSVDLFPDAVLSHIRAGDFTRFRG